MTVLYIGPTGVVFVGEDEVELVSGQVYSGRLAEKLISAIPDQVRPCDERGAVTRIAVE